MIFFGPCSGPTTEATRSAPCEMALEMQARLVELREKWTATASSGRCRSRIGINTGHASIGNFGSQSRMDYTAIGRQVNLAARLQASCEPGQILVSHSTWALVRDAIVGVPQGRDSGEGPARPREGVRGGAASRHRVADGGGRRIDAVQR